ncbi:DUF3888 domain-containing protein [Anaerobacillus sp. MEB173]|uniref:DUF3888 domain-containing protein n=1 Tax=Anaerobacillus sp. MEB173 TaxID=3383345 RepID=UPI003F93956C
MKKPITLYFFLMLIFTQQVQAETIDHDLLEGAFIEAMLPHISDAVSKKGTGRLWYRGNEKIVDISRPDPHTITSYTVTIQITTFEGAHNPPYATETMIFKLPEIELLEYNVTWGQ